MPTTITFLDHKIEFPPIESALDDPNGLLAIGGDLSVERLLLAYQRGIFPWFGENEPIMWWSPALRAVINLQHVHFAKSLKKFARTCGLTVTLNTAFTQIIKACATAPRADNGTWITNDMQLAYINMHQQGLAHSIEVWQQQQLVGGLYGVAVGQAFCGESMFHRVSNASKLAMYYLISHLRAHSFDFIDCQMMTPHLQSLGASSLSRAQFKQQLVRAQSTSTQLDHDVWLQQKLSP